ncbi:phosphoesterase PA-phosphatase releated protein [Methanocaldococcus vulcanius M7]|uniref:Phosphoesterase PA-phosphatase releated protein n=1 Tax=Methanocaldococcus vulcanius (strain ATCC 700851 / DSM 12094 / M7) TaxID=579137 RepID=C9RHA1_METVM|nr:phosphatase PAP2 family protein [Methanocaldococcus vulcanius]ACX72953.1 phosphoesterase PA-phosphatase releated protein [Methanocaldococcus vulcanius M7]
MDLYAIAESLVSHYGYVGIFLISFTEAFIQPIPPDVFIIGASYFGLNPIITAIVATVGTTLGGIFGYFLGYKLGHPIFVKIFGEKYLKKGEEFFDKYGVYGVVLAGFSPLPYKVIAWLAGIFEMDLTLFAIGTIVGRLPRFLAVAYFGNVLQKFYDIKTMNFGNINIYNFNYNLFYIINSHYNPILDIFMIILSKTVYPLVGVIALTLLIKNRKLGIKLVFCLIFAVILTYVLKYIIYEPRPYLVLSNVHLLLYKGVESSFPSGHTVLAFATATFLFFGYSRKLGILFLIWAFLVGYSRVYVGVHYPIDVFAGMIIGIVCGYIINHQFFEYYVEKIVHYGNKIENKIKIIFKLRQQ